MRFGDWYVHDATHLRHVRTNIVASHEELLTPGHVAEFIELHSAQLSTMDAVHLLVAANECVWNAFNMYGIGDWVDAQGMQRGRTAGV